MTAPRLALIGMGKMGHAIEQLAADRAWPVVARIDVREDAGKAITRESLAGADVAIEFTVPDASAHNAIACVRAGCPVVVGTTGWHDELPRVEHIVRELGGALLWSSNFSVGVNVLLKLAAELGAAITSAGGFDAHLVETHHSAKKDAPSGTAIALEQALAATLGRSVPITSVRTGSVPGTHEMIFDAPFETIRVEHIARDRRVFADGALHAAQWLVGKQGVFTMRDVLNPR